MARINTEKITIWGNLLGKGFGDSVAALADHMELAGSMVFRGMTAEIVVTAPEKRITEFIKRIVLEKPKTLEIVTIDRKPLDEEEKIQGSFSVTGVHYAQAPHLIPPEKAICPTCLREMKDPRNRRYKDPFISCNECGPGYTIIREMPFIRENTTLASFEMCPTCRQEYENTVGRRYCHAPISCLDCGPEMDYRMNGDHLSEKQELEKAAALLKEGSVIAFKSVGGYDFVANPFDQYALSALCQIKGRSEGAFAIMFRDLKELRRYARINDKEAALLKSAPRPIVQVPHKSMEELQAEHPANYDVLVKSPYLGAMLPDSGAQIQLMELFGGPLIFTSANRVGMPMISSDQAMAEFLEEEPLIAEMFYHHRNIVTSLDTSVVRIIGSKPQIVKRSKGYVPLPVYIEKNKGKILAFGGDHNSAFSLSSDAYVYLSQIFGDLSNEAKRELYRWTIDHFIELFQLQPEKVVCDMDEERHSTKAAIAFAKTYHLPIEYVQHHHAHVASVIAEHDLTGKVIGISFAEAGLGLDGTLWGGEAFLYEDGNFERVDHIPAYPLSEKRNRHSIGKALLEEYLEKGRIQPTEENPLVIDLTDIFEFAQLYRTQEEDEPGMSEKEMKLPDPASSTVEMTSSVLQLVDGVVALLGLDKGDILLRNSIEILEEAAACYMAGDTFSEAYRLAYYFVHNVAETISKTCGIIRQQTGANQVVLSGEVFRNRIIMEQTLHLLSTDGFQVNYNICVGSDDGSLALGQSFLASLQE